VNRDVISNSENLKQKNCQQLIFPSGLGYDKQNNKVQTSETNELLSLIHSLSTEIDEIKNGDSIKKDQISALVTPEGF
jgi:hemerythrin-like domain-containing protein